MWGSPFAQQPVSSVMYEDDSHSEKINGIDGPTRGEKASFSTSAFILFCTVKTMYGWFHQAGPVLTTR